jgi:hypothetical protein
MATENKKISIPPVDKKLKDGNNYPRWTRAIKIYANLLGIKLMLQPTIKPINEPTSKHDATITNSISEWENADDSAIALLEHNTKGPARDIVLDASSTWEAWENLRQYEGKNRVNLYALYNDINTLKFDDRATTIDEHIIEFNNHWSRLAATIGGDADIKTTTGVFAALTKCDEAKAVLLLSTFPDFYKLTVSIIAAQQEKFSYIHVTSQLRLLITSPKKNEKTTETYNEPSAFIAKKDNIPIYQYCKTNFGWSRRGHHESDCWKKAQANTNTTSTAMSADNNFAFMAITNEVEDKKQLPNRWEWDTTASIYMTPFKHLLEHPQPDHTKVL